MQSSRLNKLLLFLFILLGPLMSTAQVSLSSNDMIDIAVPGYDNKFTVIRDGLNTNQWYYMPDMVRLVEKRAGERQIPEFTLLRYQYHNDKNKETLVEGGFLQFGVTAQIPTDAFNEILKQLQKKYGMGIKLSSPIFKTAQVSAYSPVNTATADSSTIVGSAGVGSGIAPVFSTQKMVFSFPFNKIESNVTRDLVNSQTGVPVFLTLNYIGVTPKVVGLKVEWDWKMVYKHYSSDEKFRASASYFGLFGVSYEYSAQEIWNTLHSDNSIRISGVLGDGFTAADMEKYLQPILARINAEILKGVEPPQKVAPAAAANPSASGKFFSAGYSVAYKRESEIREGQGSFDFNIQNLVERSTIVGGFMGIGNYSEDIKKLLILNSTEDDYKSAHVILPGAMEAEQARELKINKIALSLNLANGEDKSEQQFVAMTPESNWLWQDPAKHQRNSLVLPLMEEWAKSKGEFKNKAVFQERMDIATGLNYTLTFNRSYSAYTGDGSLNSLSDNRFNIVEINPVLLNFKDGDAGGNLVQADVSLEFDNVKATKRTLKPYKEQGATEYSKPQTLKYILPNLSTLGSLRVRIVFYYKDGLKSWRYNDQNLLQLESFRDGNIVLLEKDIM